MTRLAASPGCRGGGHRGGDHCRWSRHSPHHPRYHKCGHSPSLKCAGGVRIRCPRLVVDGSDVGRGDVGDADDGDDGVFEVVYWNWPGCLCWILPGAELASPLMMRSGRR